MKFKLLAVAMMAAGVALSGCASHRGGNASAGSSRSAAEVAGDAAIGAKVKTALATDAGIGTAANVDVQTFRGVVQLNGFVASADQIQRAGDAARNVQGVRSVQNNLKVKPGS